MNSKRKIFLSIILVFVLAASASVCSASEDTDNQDENALSAIDAVNDSNSYLNSMSDDSSLKSIDEAGAEENAQRLTEETLQSNAENNIQSSSEENIIANADKNILSAKNDLYVNVYGGQYKEGSNVEIELKMMEKADHYNEESGLSHAIKNVTISVAGKTFHFDIPAGAYEEDGCYLSLGNDFASGNYTLTVTVPENDYYNAKTFTFANNIRIISESNKGEIYLDPDYIFPSGTFKGMNGTVKVYIWGIEDGDLSGLVKITLSNSKTTKTYTETINEDGLTVVNAGFDLAPGTYTVKAQHLGNNLYNPSKVVTANDKFTVYDSSSKIPVDYIYIKITNTIKGQNGTIKLDVSDDKIEGITMAGKALITLKKGTKVYKTYTVNIDKDGLCTFKLGSDLAAGNYSVTVKYYGNSYYKSYTRSYGTFCIYAKSNKIIIGRAYDYDIQNAGKGSNGYIKIDLSNQRKLGLSMAGTLTFTLTKSKTKKTFTMNIDENGVGIKKVGASLAAGKYKIKLIKYDTTFYSMKPIELDDFHVYSKTYKVPVYDTYAETFNTVKGQNGTIKIDMSSYKVPGLSMAGTAKVILNKVTYKVKINKKGIGSIKLGYNLKAGKYTAKIQYLGNSYYKKSYNDGYSFKVYDKSYKIPMGEYDYRISVSSAGLHNNATLIYDLSDYKINNVGMAGDVNITVSANGVKYYYKAKLQNNGILSLKFGDNLPIGNYSIDRITYAGNSYYAKYTVTDADNFQICSIDNKADIGNKGAIEYYGRLSSATIKEGENTALSLDFNGYKAAGLSMAQTVKIRLVNKSNNQKYTYDCAINENGKGSLILGGKLSAGTYSIQVLPFENDYYTSEYARDIYLENFKELYLKVDLKNKASTSIAYKNAKGKADPNFASFKNALKDEKGNKLTGKTVEVKFNGKTYYLVTDENGKATFKAYAKAAKKYSVAATYKGDDAYSSASIKGSVKISENKVKFSKATKKVKRSSAKKNFKISLKTSNKKALKAKKVYLKIKGKTYKAKTNNKGVAVFKINLPSRSKTYKYKVSFKGDKGNYKKTFSGKLKVY